MANQVGGHPEAGDREKIREQKEREAAAGARQQKAERDKAESAAKPHQRMQRRHQHR